MAITYNGSDPFLGQPTPFVRISNEYSLDGDERIDRTNITLQGELLACSGASLLSLMSGLQSSFQTRSELIVDGLDTYQIENVESVNFSESPMFGRVSYTISLQAKDDKQVLDKRVEYSFEESIDQSLNITRTISAKGKEITSTTDQAWTHLKNYISSQASKALPRPFSIDSKLYNYFLVSSNEEFDRINKTMSLTQNFRSELYRNTSSILRHTTTETKQIGTEATTQIQGSIDYGRQNTLAPAMAEYAAFKNSLVNSSGQPIRNLKNEQVTIDENAGKISFSFDYSEGLEDATNDGFLTEYSVSLEESGDSSLITAKIDGRIRIVSSFTQAKRSDLLNQFQTKIVNSGYLYGKVNALYLQFYSPPAGINLCTKPLSSNYSLSKNGTEIKFSASFNDRFVLDGFETFDYSISTEPALKIISIKPSLKGGYYFVDMGFVKKAKKSINVSSYICGEDMSFNQLDWANLKLLQHIESNKSSEGKKTVTEKSYSATNSLQFSSKITRIYDGETFLL